jgi:DinB superfamily
VSEPAPRFTLDQVVEMLAAGPDRIAAATADVSGDELLAPLEGDGWSARDVLGHMRACQHTWGGYIGRILDEDRPTFRAESPRSTIRRTDFLTLPFAESLDGFVADRAALVTRLRAAGPDLESRRAIVQLVGRGAEERSAFHYAHRLAEHEREHVMQIERSMGARRGSRVEPSHGGN